MRRNENTLIKFVITNNQMLQKTIFSIRQKNDNFFNVFYRLIASFLNHLAINFEQSTDLISICTKRKNNGKTIIVLRHTRNVHVIITRFLYCWAQIQIWQTREKRKSFLKKECYVQKIYFIKRKKDLVKTPFRKKKPSNHAYAWKLMFFCVGYRSIAAFLI